MSGVPPPLQRTRTPVIARPAVWMLVLLLVVGGWRLGEILHRTFLVYPVATAAALILFAVYAIPFVVLVRLIDYLDRDPPALLAAGFAWGGLVATSAAISGSAALQNILAKQGSPELAAQWGPALAGAGVEEILKVLGVFAIALVTPYHTASIVSGFSYGALVGLGFQVIEGVVYAVSAAAVYAGHDQVGPVVAAFLVRGFMAGLWSHTLFTALAGAGVAYALVRRDQPVLLRGGVALGLFLTAWGFHFLWNSPVLSVRLGREPFASFVGAFVIILVKGLPALLVGTVLIVAAERRESDYYAAVLAGLGDPRIATASEIDALVSPRRRLAARKHARLRLGRAGARAVGRLQRAQARLAVAVSREPGPAPQLSPEVMRLRRVVLRRRHELMALGLGVRETSLRRPAVIAVSALVVGALLIILLLVGADIIARALG